jgi:hypothetical protein
MCRVRPLVLWIILLLMAAGMLACGLNSSQLKSLTVSPSMAQGNTQFTAIGIRVNGERVSPVSALWWNIPPWTTIPTTPPGFQIDSNGNATCLSLAGTFMVYAAAPVNSHVPLSQMTLTTAQVVGSAQITCP